MGGRKHFKKGGGTFISEFLENKGGNTQSQLIFQLWHQHKKDQRIQMPNDLNPPPSITLLWVGDIREPQQSQLKFYKEHKFLYITTLYVALMK